MKLRTASVLLALLASASPAFAAQISGLFDTGSSFATNAQDTHYALSVMSGSTTGLDPYGYVADNAGWPDGSPWVSSGGAKWLTPTASEDQSFDPSSNGVYLWRLSFNLTGFDATTASFSGKWAADNGGSVLLNGTQIGTSGGFSSLSSFSATSGFFAGVNTLDFKVTNLQQNGGNPTGLMVDFTSSNVAPIPEPETYAMLLAGLGFMGFVARRRKQQSAT